MKNFFDRSKEIISSSMGLGENVLMGHPLVEFEGRSKVRIENHKGIVKYSQNEIIVNTILGSVIISGTNMNILGLLEYELVIKGDIESVRYL